MPKAVQRNPDAIRFGAIVRRIRKERGWRIRKLAPRLGMHPTYIGLVESGGNLPSLSTVLEMADVFNVPAAQLMQELEDGRRKRGQPT